MFSHLKSEVKLNMKTTGIVRRIDELGRVVIPKEIRKTMRLKEGEELEVFVNDEETLVLKKYSTIKSFKELAKEYVEVLYKHTGYNCLITDTDEVIAAAQPNVLNLASLMTSFSILNVICIISPHVALPTVPIAL